MGDRSSKASASLTPTTFFPVRTRVFSPPRDAVVTELLQKIPPLQDGDLVVVTSKVVAIEQGRCRMLGSHEAKESLVKEWSDYFIPKAASRYGVALSMVYHAIIGTAGIDESNGDGFLIFLPEKPSVFAADFASQLRALDAIDDCGVIITDSHCMPLRQGVVGIAIGASGFEVLHDYRGTPDLFGRSYRVSQANHADAIAAAACGVMGEGAEATPAVVVRGWPRLKFDKRATLDTLLIEPQDDIFSSMLQVFQKGDGRVRRGGVTRE